VPRKAFYSFHYDDNWRAAQVRSMGVIEGNEPCSDNDWETVKGGGDPAIEKWIAEQLEGKTCAIVLVGSARLEGSGSPMRSRRRGTVEKAS
jgi:hypothetical protein